MATRFIVAPLLLALWTLSGCTSTASNNTSYSQSQGFGPNDVVGDNESDDPGGAD
jgi:hypothetical protein